MKRWIVLLLVAGLTVPLACRAAGVPGYLKERLGTLTGQVVDDAGAPLGNMGVVSFFSTEKGIPPLIGNIHRVPDMIGRMENEGRFTVKLMPGTYYMGAMIVTDTARKPGPPREGEQFFFIRDEKGSLQEITIGSKEEKNVGAVVGALPETFPMAKNLVTIEGRLLMENGQPFAGGVVLVKKDMGNPRPDFVSQRTGEDGKFSLRLPADTPYYLLGRERSVGRPVPGTYIGTYGSTSPISQGGALPIGNVRPPQPASARPGNENVPPGPGQDLPVTVMGKAGESMAGIDILMFRMPVPGEQREKLQGTLGFGQKKDGSEEKGTEPVPPGK